MAQNFKLKVLTLISKLSDRDTYNLAAAELDSIAGALDNTTLPTFVSCILSTGTTDKALVRRQCLHLISTLSVLYSNSLSSFLPKIISYIARRLRDLDSSIRSQCVTTVSALASKITKQPFSAAFLKPLSELVFTEQDSGAQIGSALCLAAAIDAAPDPEPARLGKMLVSKLERLLKSDGYKSKSAALVVIGSVIGVGGVRGYGGMGGLVKALVGFLSSDDWAARKAAAEALGRLAVVESDAMAEFKSGCLKVFENRKFDKVKATREVMNQMIEAWKQISDLSEEVSPPPRSQASSKEDPRDGRNPASSKHSAGYETPKTRKQAGSTIRKTPPDNIATPMSKTKSSLKITEKKTGPSMFRNVERKKPFEPRVEVSTPECSSVASENDSGPIRRLTRPETKRSLFGMCSDEKGIKFGGCKSGSRVAPCHEETPASLSTGVASGASENQHNNHKECEDLSSIRNQLVQIERQQSSLLDLLQRFMGNSQNGMRSLETRVQGLELALDEISYDLAVSTGRMADSKRTMCCMLPGADFLSSKIWRKTENRYSNSRFSMSGTPSLTAMRNRAERNGQLDSLYLETRRLRLQGGSGLIVNPLAEVHDSRGPSVAAQ